MLLKYWSISLYGSRFMSARSSKVKNFYLLLHRFGKYEFRLVLIQRILVRKVSWRLMANQSFRKLHCAINSELGEYLIASVKPDL